MCVDKENGYHPSGLHLYIRAAQSLEAFISLLSCLRLYLVSVFSLLLPFDCTFSGFYYPFIVDFRLYFVL